ncbi:serine/threonine-protein kinase RsbW [Krasilnikovia cinnamomea]|uniref:Serine/threonine-protein kinase RsbW n=1 Tax=Krasilnikovia cinnamomea TaxID=349313 RepID=A0A4Q7ZNE8_9ACTN|nr:SpoIIE family protein phosphatase [Krasilnikovia cinnamomea]RZU52558.1 serine/threonine-protein kinase RsbW [Krasilnikovia cinnamomea]
MGDDAVRSEMTQELRLPWEEDPEELYEHAPCGYLTTLPDGTIVRVNQTLLTWTGHQRSALVGRRRFRDLLTADSRNDHETRYAPLLAMQGDVREVAFDIVCADGRELPTLVNSVVSRDAGGLPRVIRTTIFDATERRGYEQELLAARRAAEASERRVGVLQQIVAELAAAPTEAEVAEAVLRAPGPAFGALDASIWLVDPDGDRLVVVASTGPAPPGGEQVPRSSSRPVAQVARRGDLHVIGSVREAAEHFPELAETMRRTGRSTVVLLPLTAGPGPDADPPDVLGVLAFGFVEQRTLSGSELRVVRLLGHQAGQALDRARLYDATRRREARAVFLAETTRALEELPRLLPRARRLVERIVPEVAGWAEVRLRVGPAGVVAEAGAPAPDPRWLTERVAAVTTSGDPEYATGAPDTDGGGTGPQRDCTVLPLTVRGRVLGTLALRPASGQRLAGTGFLRELADRAALSLENARLYEQERTIARSLQRSLLAGDLPADSRYTLETYYQAAGQDLEVGGDWFDAFRITGDKLGVVVGDVVGRGIDAATTMGQLRSAIRALASAEAGPARLLERLDRFVERVESARMTTVAYAEINLATSEMTYACAGHQPPLLAEPGSAPRYLLDGRSGPLGSRAARVERVEHRIRLSAGSRLLLYTDGLIERRDRPLDAGFEVLARAYARCRDAPLPGLAARLADLLVGRDHGDDVCLLCLAMGTEERLERSIGADPMQIALLRKDLRGWLAAHAVDADSSEAVLLACSEAVANAIEHGYRDDPFGMVRVVASVAGSAVEVRVADRGTWRQTREEDVRGRGLRLMRQVMDEVVIARGEGTTITMRRGRRGQP